MRENFGKRRFFKRRPLHHQIKIRHKIFVRREIASGKWRICADLEREHLALFQLDFSIAQLFTKFEEIGGSGKKVFNFVVEFFVCRVLFICERVTREFVITKPRLFRDIDFPACGYISSLYHVVCDSLRRRDNLNKGFGFSG